MLESLFMGCIITGILLLWIGLLYVCLKCHKGSKLTLSEITLLLTGLIIFIDMVDKIYV